MMHFFSSAQQLISGELLLSKPTSYQIISLPGEVVDQSTATTISFSSYADGVYVVYFLEDHKRLIVMVIDGQAVGMRRDDDDSGNQKCSQGIASVRPFTDSTSMMAYLHSYLDTIPVIEDKLVMLTALLTKWYPLALHGSWVQQSYLWPFGNMVNHFTQIDSMGMCGDQSNFLGTFAYHLFHIRSCAISIRELDNDTTTEGHVQVLFEVPRGPNDTVWGIFDSQNGVVYRDEDGKLADFRAIRYGFTQPIAYELKPICRYYTEWDCTSPEYSFPFPFDKLRIFNSPEEHPIDRIIYEGERTMVYMMEGPGGPHATYRAIGATYGIATEAMTTKELIDALPRFVDGIYETNNYQPWPYGIPDNMQFAYEVRMSTGLQQLKWETANTLNPVIKGHN